MRRAQCASLVRHQTSIELLTIVYPDTTTVSFFGMARHQPPEKKISYAYPVVSANHHRLGVRFEEAGSKGPAHSGCCRKRSEYVRFRGQGEFGRRPWVAFGDCA